MDTQLTCIFPQVGTLDTLVGLSDDLNKLDGYVDRYQLFNVGSFYYLLSNLYIVR